MNIFEQFEVIDMDVVGHRNKGTSSEHQIQKFKIRVTPNIIDRLLRGIEERIEIFIRDGVNKIVFGDELEEVQPREKFMKIRSLMYDWIQEFNKAYEAKKHREDLKGILETKKEGQENG